MSFCIVLKLLTMTRELYYSKRQTKIQQDIKYKELILIQIFLMQVLMIIEQGNKCAITASSDTRDTRTLTPTSWCYKYNRGFPCCWAYCVFYIHIHSCIFAYICAWPGPADPQLLLTQVTTTSRVLWCYVLRKIQTGWSFQGFFNHKMWFTYTYML